MDVLRRPYGIKAVSAAMVLLLSVVFGTVKASADETPIIGEDNNISFFFDVRDSKGTVTLKTQEGVNKWMSDAGEGRVYCQAYDSLINKMVLGSKINSIDGRAGAMLGSLSVLEKASGNNYFSVSDNVLYGANGTTLVMFPGGKSLLNDSYTVPTSVRRIGNYAFAGNASLKSVNLNQGLSGIGEGAFGLCTGLTEITIPSSVTRIGSYAFWGCYGIKSIRFESVTPPALEEAVFYGVDPNVKIYVPQGSEGEYAKVLGTELSGRIVSVAEPTAEVTEVPVPTEEVTPVPTVEPTTEPEATAEPTAEATSVPEEEVVTNPTITPLPNVEYVIGTTAPTATPSPDAESVTDTTAPTVTPAESTEPTVVPTNEPTVTADPTLSPTPAALEPTAAVTDVPAATDVPEVKTGLGRIDALEEKILNETNDNDIPVSDFITLQAKTSKVSGTYIKLSWKAPADADSYVVYSGLAGRKNKYVKTASVTKTSFRNSGLKKGTYYKYIVVALDEDKNVLAVSKTVFAATKGGKVTNCKSISIRKNKLSLKSGKTYKLSGKACKDNKSLKLRNYRSIRYVSSNPNIAVVSSQGVVRGMRKGKCVIYAYAQNGVSKKISITVK